MNVVRQVSRLNHRFTPAVLGACLAVLAGSAGSPAQNGSADDETCLACHEGYDQKLHRTPHRLASDGATARVQVACGSCHAGGEVHVEDPSTENITNPATASDQEVATICQACHTAHLELDNIGFDPHLQQGLSCVSCHGVHSGNEGLLLDDSNEFCARCHAGVIESWHRTSVHPLLDGQIRCLSCHDFTGTRHAGFGYGQAQNCVECHMEVAGPYLWEHEAASSFTPDGEGCVACHAPHGSANDRLLTRPGNALCTHCHVVPPLHRTFHGGVGAQFQCIECHVSVHGSDHNRALLDPDLGSKIGALPEGCYCHGPDR